jgi:hypothetical protein
MRRRRRRRRKRRDRCDSVNGHRFTMPITVEGVIRGLRWGIGPEGGKAFSSHHIGRSFHLPARSCIGQH